jgi:nitrite reductase/ring-hydroxylating ferredoxin subunit
VNFQRACGVEEIAAGNARLFVAGGERIAVFHVEGRFYATQDACPHGLWSLSQSYIEGSVVECALHNGRYSICSGKRLGPPVSRPLRTYAVKIESDAVWVDVDSAAPEERPGAVRADSSRLAQDGV